MRHKLGWINIWGVNIENSYVFLKIWAPNQNKFAFWIFFFMFQNQKKIFIDKNICAFPVLWTGGEVDFAYSFSLSNVLYQIALFPEVVLYLIFLFFQIC